MSDAAHAHVFHAKLVWTGAAKGGTTNYDTYSREYRVDIPGKPSLTGSAAPVFKGDAALQNPEDWLVAALSACHALTYLALCARKRIEVVAYEDDAVGKMEEVDKVIRFTDVLLKPVVTLRQGADLELARSLHEKAHHHCFIANSVNFPVRNDPRLLTCS